MLDKNNSHNRIQPWTHTDPSLGNRWQALSQGKRVMAFSIWLYCDDTSGNRSKKWNKHHSWLFTAAGLPRRHVHRETNIHFLGTSNLAPALEMLDGVSSQLRCVSIWLIDSSIMFKNKYFRDCQESGVWAWDCMNNELVLVIPSVLAMVGDNPMQSEFACHGGLKCMFFCRACWVQNDGRHDPEADNIENDPGDNHSDTSSVNSQNSVDSAANHPTVSSILEQEEKRKKINKSKGAETMEEMVQRVLAFMRVSRLSCS
jgi:hypothetical protein